MAQNGNRRRRRQRVVGTEAVSTERREGGQIVDAEESLESPAYEVPERFARVRVEGSVTQNMGDYNSVRVGVVIERPCADTDEAIDQTYRDISSKVDEYVQEELSLAMGGGQD